MSSNVPDFTDYSIVSLIRQRMASPDGHLDGLEGEVGRVLAQRGRPPKSFGGDLLPTDLPEARALDTVTGAGALAQGYVGPVAPALRSRLVLGQLGATILPGLVGEGSMPIATGGTRAYWVTEHNAAPESNAGVESVPLVPKTVSVRVEISRHVIKLGGDAVEAFVRDDIFGALAAEVDRAGLMGSGVAGQPLGLLVDPTIPVVALGANGGPLDWPALCSLERAIADDDADRGMLGFATSPAGRAFLRQAARTGGGGPAWQGGRVLDYPAVASSAIPSDLSKGTAVGTLTAAVLGSFDQLIVGYWGAIEVLVDSYTSPAGTIKLTAFLTVGVAARRVDSFRRVVDFLPTIA